jgi:predicted PolB exonuclease-like 3'-5' exonuclease
MEMIPAPEEMRAILERRFHEKGKKDEELSDAFERTSVDGAWGRILCIAYAFGDDPIEVLYNESLDERVLLEEFWRLARRAKMLVGHKILDADIPFLHKRSIVYGVRVPFRLNLEPGKEKRIFDTAHEWGLGKGYTSLEDVSLALGIRNPKEAMHGSQVPKYFRQGRIEEILQYCKGDVEAVREIYKKIVLAYY